MRRVMAVLLLPFGLLSLSACNSDGFWSGSASMRVEVSVYKGPLANPEEIQQAQLTSILESAHGAVVKRDQDLGYSMCRLGCVSEYGDGEKFAVTGHTVPSYAECSTWNIPQRRVRVKSNYGGDQFREEFYEPATRSCKKGASVSADKAVFACKQERAGSEHDPADRIISNEPYRFTSAGSRFPDMSNYFQTCKAYEDMRRTVRIVRLRVEGAVSEGNNPPANSSQKPTLRTAVNGFGTIGTDGALSIRTAAFEGYLHELKKSLGPATPDALKQIEILLSLMAQEGVAFDVSPAMRGQLERLDAALARSGADLSAARKVLVASDTDISTREELSNFLRSLPEFKDKFQKHADWKWPADDGVAVIKTKDIENKKDELKAALGKFQAADAKLSSQLKDAKSDLEVYNKAIKSAIYASPTMTETAMRLNFVSEKSEVVSSQISARENKSKLTSQAAQKVLTEIENNNTAQIASELKALIALIDKDSKLRGGTENASLDIDFKSVRDEIDSLIDRVTEELGKLNKKASDPRIQSAIVTLENQSAQISAARKDLKSVLDAGVAEPLGPDMQQRAQTKQFADALRNSDNRRVYGKIGQLAASFRLLSTELSYKIASVYPDDKRLRVDVNKTANLGAEYANQLTSRAAALSLQSEKTNREYLSTGQMLRDTQPTAYLDLYSWIPDSAANRGTDVDERIKIAKRLFDDDNWSKVNEVYASGTGETSMAFIRDELGNWNLKSFSNDPSDLLNAYQDVAMGLAEKAASLAASGTAVGKVAEAFNLSQQVKMGIAEPTSNEQKAGALIGSLDLISIRSELRSELEDVAESLATVRASAEETARKQLTEGKETEGEAAEVSDEDVAEEAKKLIRKAEEDARRKTERIAMRYKDLINALTQVTVSQETASTE